MTNGTPRRKWAIVNIMNYFSFYPHQPPPPHLTKSKCLHLENSVIEQLHTIVLMWPGNWVKSTLQHHLQSKFILQQKISLQHSEDHMLTAEGCYSFFNGSQKCSCSIIHVSTELICFPKDHKTRKLTAVFHVLMLHIIMSLVHNVQTSGPCVVCKQYLSGISFLGNVN